MTQLALIEESHIVDRTRPTYQHIVVAGARFDVATAPSTVDENVHTRLAEIRQVTGQFETDTLDLSSAAQAGGVAHDDGTVFDSLDSAPFLHSVTVHRDQQEYWRVPTDSPEEPVNREVSGSINVSRFSHIMTTERPDDFANGGTPQSGGDTSASPAKSDGRTRVRKRPSAIGGRVLMQTQRRDRSDRLTQVVSRSTVVASPGERPPDNGHNGFRAEVDDLVPALPASVTPFVGREGEIATLRDMLRQPQIRLLTLTGPGGVGKTRLAAQVAESIARDFPDGLSFVPLAGVRDPGIVPSAIARALGVREVGHRPLLEGIAAFCREGEILLLLDNFEQVAAAAPFIAQLLARCAKLKCLATSRALLRVSGEHAFPVSPLPLPPTEEMATAEQAGIAPAVRLFVARARAVDPMFALNESNATAIATICRRLDGLPLAIELAAAKIRHLTPAELASRLTVKDGGTALHELADGPRDAPARQQTLSYAIGWSYDLLTQAQQVAFRRLGVFVGGFTLEAAEAVASATGEAAINAREAVVALADQSLLRREEDPGGGSRYEMLETVREFALEQLVATGEDDAVSAAHASYFLTLAEWAAPQLSTEHQQAWLDKLQAELPNTRAVLWRMEQRHDIDRALRLAAALWRFWHRRGYWEEGRRRLVRLLALAEQHDDVGAETLATALTGAGWLAHYQGDFAAARIALEDGLERFRRLGRHEGEVDALHCQALVAQSLGENERAAKLGEEALSLARLSRDHARIADSLCYLSRATRELGDYARAAALAEEALVLHRATRNRGGTAVALLVLSDVARDLAETANAYIWCEESLAIFRELGEPLGEGFVLHNLAVTAYNDGDTARALTQCRESLAIFRRLDLSNAVAEVLASFGTMLESDGEPEAALAALTEGLALAERVGPGWVVAAILEGIGTVAAGQGQYQLVVELAGGAAALRKKIGVPVRPNWRNSIERALAASREALGQEAFDAAWAQEQERPRSQLVAGARAVRVMSVHPAVVPRGLQKPSQPFGLSPRELDVVRLIVAGKTDREIADELFISPRTASKHVGAILLKLNVGSRGEAAVHAIRHGLI